MNVVNKKEWTRKVKNMFDIRVIIILYVVLLFVDDDDDNDDECEMKINSSNLATCKCNFLHYHMWCDEKKDK